ncbi:MAG: hypothetical protein IJT98_07265 [Prevotella sp.]|nr:hypothetical protein [Prevotella sp.]
MNRIAIYRLLWHNDKLSEKRNPAFEQGIAAKVLMWIGALMMGGYMIFLGSLFGKLAAEEDIPPFILMIMPVLMLLDFFMRFLSQQTPMMFVRPYLLMPMPLKRVVEAYLLTQLGNTYNLLWLALFLPYSFVAVMGGVDLLTLLAVTVAGMLLVFINSMWYLLARTLIRRSLLWWLLVIGVWGIVFLPFILTITISDHVFDRFVDFMDFMDSPALLWLAVLVVLGVLAGFVLLNRSTQIRFVRQEMLTGQKGEKALKRVSNFTFLEHFGLMGDYLKLELKSIMRNKAIRTRVFMSLGLMVMFSLIITFTDIYDNAVMLNFWCYYCFAIYGATTLTKIMAPEGNYIDLLMTQRENILLLLRAKYIFHVAILLVPFVIMLPAVISGKFSLMMMVAYFLTTSGMAYFLLFQLAVYNKQTLPLNSKITGKSNMESGYQLFFELTTLFLPLLVMVALMFLCSELTAFIVLTAIGLAMTLASPLWLRNIYHRQMSRKYVNMEGFHATR